MSTIETAEREFLAAVDRKDASMVLSMINKGQVPWTEFLDKLSSADKQWIVQVIGG